MWPAMPMCTPSSGSPVTEFVMVPETVPHGSTAQSGGRTKFATGCTSFPSAAAA